MTPRDDTRRFVPHLEEIEGRLTPATNLTPEQVFGAAALAELYFNGTRAALSNPGFFVTTANRAPTQALAATIVAQAPALADVLNSYAVQLQGERAADPARADFFDPFIARYAGLAAQATQAAAQAQAVSARIDALNAAGTGTGGFGTGGTGTTTGGLTGGQTVIGGIGNTGVNTSNGAGTTTGTTGTGTTSGVGAGTSGITTGPGTTTGTGTGTTGGGTTGGTTGGGTTGTGTGPAGSSGTGTGGTL